MRVAGKTHCHGNSRPALGYLRGKRVRELDPAGVRSEVARVESAYAFDLALQGTHRCGGEKRHPVFVALALADDDLIRRELDVLHPQPRAFEKAEPCAVHEKRHELRDFAQVLEHGAGFFAREHDREPLRPRGTYDLGQPREPHLQDLAVEK